MIGQTVSHYRILEELGGGGMGVVYKAEDTKLKRTVALKFLPPDLTRDKDAKTRFIHEAQAASALQHNNICAIHEIDETDDGRLFIAMDCYEGETLKDRIARGPLSVDDATDIASQAAEGLAKAHEAGMVHRDIKPANIMITRDGVVKIVDFGLAKLAGQTKVTKTGTTVGTVAYMSPEQASGKEINHRSDIFSLGVVLYEMLAGEVPFKGDHEAAVLYGIVNIDPVEVTAIRPEIPRGLQNIVRRALAKDPAKRYASVSQLLEELAPWRLSRSSGAGIAGASTAKSGLSRVIMIAGVIIVAVALAFFAGKKWIGAPSAEELSLAVVDFHDLVDPDDPARSAEITGLLYVGLVETSPMRVVSTDLIRDMRRRSFGSARGPIEADQVLEVVRQAGATMFLSGQVKAGEYVMWRLVETSSGRTLGADRVDGESMPALVDDIVAAVLPLLVRESGTGVAEASRTVASMTTASEEAYRHYSAGLVAKETSRDEEAFREFETAVEIDSTFALAYLELSRWYSRETALARVYSEKAWAHRVNLGLKDRMRLEAWRLWLDYREEDALSTEREMLERWPDDRTLLKDHVERLWRNWHHEECLKIAARGADLYPDDATFGLFHWATLALSDRFDEALAAVRAQSGYPKEATTWDDLGTLYYWMGQPDSAEVAFRRALEIDSTFVYSRNGIAACAYARGDLEEAIGRLHGCLGSTDLSWAQKINFRVRMLNWTPGLAWIYAEAGRFTEAFDIIDETREFASDPNSELRWVLAPRFRLLFRTGGAGEVLEWTREAVNSDIRVTRMQAVKFRAQALVALDSLEAARDALAALAETKPYWGGYTRHMTLWVRAELALAEGDPKAALVPLRELGRVRVYGAVEDIEYLEMLARAYEMSSRYEDAVAVHRDLLRIYGGHALSHYELGRIYQELGRSEDAKQELSKFLEMWADADEGLPQLEDARTRLAALDAGS